jgi:hypothetical protein
MFCFCGHVEKQKAGSVFGIRGRSGFFFSVYMPPKKKLKEAAAMLQRTQPFVDYGFSRADVEAAIDSVPQNDNPNSDEVLDALHDLGPLLRDHAAHRLEEHPPPPHPGLQLGGDYVLLPSDAAAECTVCMGAKGRAKLQKCGCVVACGDCCDNLMLTRCPLCRKHLHIGHGDSPPGTVSVRKFPSPLPGHDGVGHWSLLFVLPGGQQTERVGGKPGTDFWGKETYSYFPDTQDGRDRAERVIRAFVAGHMFAVGLSVTMNKDNRTTFNGVHLKTSRSTQTGDYCYPDKTYLSRVDNELADKGF